MRTDGVRWRRGHCDSDSPETRGARVGRGIGVRQRKNPTGTWREEHGDLARGTRGTSSRHDSNGDPITTGGCPRLSEISETGPSTTSGYSNTVPETTTSERHGDTPEEWKPNPQAPKVNYVSDPARLLPPSTSLLRPPVPSNRRGRILVCGHTPVHIRYVTERSLHPHPCKQTSSGKSSPSFSTSKLGLSINTQSDKLSSLGTPKDTR